AADIQAAGVFPVTVNSPSPGGGTTSAINFTVFNPAPTLGSISPASVTVGGSTITLTVNGTNFNSSSVVHWNGNNRTTTFVSATQLTAKIMTGDIQATGVFPVTVNNPSPGGGISS